MDGQPLPPSANARDLRLETTALSCAVRSRRAESDQAGRRQELAWTTCEVGVQPEHDRKGVSDVSYNHVDGGRRRPDPIQPRCDQGRRCREHVERPLLTWDDIDRLARAIEPRFSALGWVAATSALRFGELTGLDRSLVDLESGTIRVDRALAFQKGEGPTLGPPKSDAAYRVVALPATVTDLLRTHLADYTDAAPSSLVFTSVKGQPVAEPLLRSILGTRQASSRCRRVRTVPRSSTLRRHRRGVIGSVAPGGHVAHGPLMERCITSLPQGWGGLRSRSGHRHRASNARYPRALALAGSQLNGRRRPCIDPPTGSLPRVEPNVLPDL